MKKTALNSFEIAKLAGVSRSTVSRVINNYSNVPPETREKVMSIIQQYNYYPNHAARSLVGQKVSTIGLFIIEKEDNVASSIYFNLFLGSIIDKSSSMGYHVLTYIIRDTSDFASINSVKEVFFQRRVDGGIFLGAMNHEPLIEELIAEGFFVGVVDQDLPGSEESNRIVLNIENEEGARKAVDYLAGLNHKRIGILSGSLHSHSGLARYQGFLAGMKSNGLTINSTWVLQGEFKESKGYQAMSRLIKSGYDLPTAVFAANDDMARGAVKAIQEAGKRVPEDISVIGFDDLISSQHVKPALTTLKVDYIEMGRAIASKLIDIIESGGSDTHHRLVFPVNIVERESCHKL